jgi:ADP-ribose pyrophosphatase YjhB (NUDIX family)
MNKNKYCGYCGNLFYHDKWPRHCGECGNITWKNPVPVTFALQPVHDPIANMTGLAVARRAINPHSGRWAFMGGYVDMCDPDLVEAARREFREESSIDIAGPGKIIHTESNICGNMVVAVMFTECFSIDAFNKGTTCSENHELGIMWTNDHFDLCFPIHKKVASMWFNGDFD